MINELEIVLFENLLKREQMKKLTFTELKIIATELPFLTSIGYGIYKAITLFNTKYKNEHQILVLEGFDQKKNPVNAITELVSASSGIDISGEETGYYLFLTPCLEEFFIYRELKNPFIREIKDIHLYGDQLFNLVLDEKKEYKLIGNNCQDYTFRMTNFIEGISKQNKSFKHENLMNNYKKKTKSKSIQISNLKKNFQSNSMVFNKFLINYNLQGDNTSVLSDLSSKKGKSVVLENSEKSKLVLPKIEKSLNVSLKNTTNTEDKISNFTRPSIILENTQNEISLNNILPSENLMKSSNSFFKLKVPSSNVIRAKKSLQMIKEVQNEAQISFIQF
jgi:hypothetical protein